MNDALYEQLVPRKQKTSGILISILIIVLAVAVAVCLLYTSDAADE